MKTAIIAIAKNEQLYIKEWIDYHLNIGFDTIIIGDNDDSLILSDFASDKVIIEDFTGVKNVQTKAYTELFKKYRNQFDWILFIDIDEFLVIQEGSVKDFLSCFPNDYIIRLNMKHFTDNDELDVIDNNYSVFDRFKTEVRCVDDYFVKSFIRGDIFMVYPYIYGHGIYNKKLQAVDAEGKPCTSVRQTIDRVVYNKAWINHYRTKTIGEYIRQKYNRGGSNNNPSRYNNWQVYFSKTNNLTEEKIEYAEKLISELTPQLSNKQQS